MEGVGLGLAGRRDSGGAFLQPPDDARIMMRGPSTPCGDVRAELAGDSDLTIMRPRTRPNGEPCEVEVRWVIYHMLEHFGGHFGQILLLQHARQALGVGDAAGR